MADDRARVVVIGGGVAGTSIAYHLTRLGWTDVLLVDRGELTSGSTFHSAGLVAQLRNSVSHTRMMMYGAELYPTLAEETGVDPGWHQVGTLHLASSAVPDGGARATGRVGEVVRPPGRDRVDRGCARAVPVDRRLPRARRRSSSRPTATSTRPGSRSSFAAGAKTAGARVRTGVRVEEITVRDGRVAGVVTDHGAIEAEVVVNAGGIWAHELGRLAGVEIPVVPMEHQYLITRPIEGVRADFPTLRDPDNLVYVREEVGGLVVGGYERNPDPWHVSDPIPRDFNHRLLPEKWERFESIADGAFRLIPPLQTTEINRFINGPEAFTPDDDFILGETEVRGFFVAAGFCAHGVTGAAGIGRWTAEWIVEGEPSMDLSKMDIRRFGRQYASRDYSLAKAYEIYAKHYDVRYPGEENEAGRPLRMAPTYGRLEKLDAEFGEKAGWERANWFRSNEDPAHEDRRPRGWAGEQWSTAIVAEHLAVREQAALFDETSFAKFEVSGPGALRPAAAAVRERRGRAGRPDRVHADAEPPRRDRDRPDGDAPRRGSVPARDRHGLRQPRPRVDPAAPGGRGRARPRRHVEPGVPGDLGAGGPRRPAGADATTTCRTSAFPYMSGRDIEVGDVPCFAARVTYVGELGLGALPARPSSPSALWDTLLEAGAPHGLVPGGYRAIDSLRLEKGYRSWGADITPDDSPLEAGLGFAVAFDKDADFLGRDAVRRLRDEGVTRHLRCLDARGRALVHPRERARARRRRDRRPDHVGRDRLRRGEEHRVRVPAGRARRGRHEGLDRGLRGMGGRRGRGRAALGPCRREDQGLMELRASISTGRWRS